jgi:hypothetical protein
MYWSDGLCQAFSSNDIVVNEILFNPVKDGFDYVECYNRSGKDIPLNDLSIANRNSTNDIAGIKTVTKDSLHLKPGAYLVITANEKWLRQKYSIPAAAIVCQVSGIPSLPDDEGTIILLRGSDSAVIDEIKYSSGWHFQLIDDPSGVALERISPDFPSQDRNNWTSASSSSGFGTPGAENSQFKQNTNTGKDVAVLPKVFSPNNDGIDDFAQVTIINHVGKIANAVIYDVNGRSVRYLVKNELLGSNNSFVWDGYDDRSQKLPTGIYIVYTQIFDTKGNKNRFRNCIVLNSLRK